MSKRTTSNHDGFWDAYDRAPQRLSLSERIEWAQQNKAGSGASERGTSGGFADVIAAIAPVSARRMQARAEERAETGRRRQASALGREMQRQRAWAERKAAIKAKLAALFTRRPAAPPAPKPSAPAPRAFGPLRGPLARLFGGELPDATRQDARMADLHETGQMFDIRPLRRAQALEDGDRTGWAQDLSTVIRVRQWERRAQALTAGDATDLAIDYHASASRRATGIAARTMAALSQPQELQKRARHTITPEPEQQPVSAETERAAARAARL